MHEDIGQHGCQGPRSPDKPNNLCQLYGLEDLGRQLIHSIVALWPKFLINLDESCVGLVAAFH
jgi:hypothetical protein